MTFVSQSAQKLQTETTTSDWGASLRWFVFRPRRTASLPGLGGYPNKLNVDCMYSTSTSAQEHALSDILSRLNKVSETLTLQFHLPGHLFGV